MSNSFAIPLGLPPLPPELAALAAPLVPENPDDVVRQAFRIGHMHLLAPFDTASELTEMPNVYPLPRMPEWTNSATGYSLAQTAIQLKQWLPPALANRLKYN